MTDPIPYADYVRIEVRLGGETRIVEFTPQDGGDKRPQIKVTPADPGTDVILFGDPRMVRDAPRPWPTMTFEVSGPQSRITVEEKQR